MKVAKNLKNYDRPHCSDSEFFPFISKSIHYRSFSLTVLSTEENADVDFQENLIKWRCSKMGAIVNRRYSFYVKDELYYPKKVKIRFVY